METQTKLVSLKEMPKSKAVFRSLLKEIRSVVYQRSDNVVCRLNQLKQSPVSIKDEINKLISANSNNPGIYEIVVKFPDGSVWTVYTKHSPLSFETVYCSEKKKYYQNEPYATSASVQDSIASFENNYDIDECKEWFGERFKYQLIKRIDTLSIQFPVIAPEAALSEYKEIVDELNSWLKDSILVWAMKNHKKEAAKSKNNC